MQLPLARDVARPAGVGDLGSQVGRKSFVFNMDHRRGHRPARGPGVQHAGVVRLRGGRESAGPKEIVKGWRDCRERRSRECETSAGVRRQESGVSQRRRVRPSPAAAAHRPAHAPPHPVPSCIAAAGAARHSAARHLGRIAAIGQRPQQARQRRIPRAHGAARGSPAAALPTPARRPQPAPTRAAPRVRQTIGAGGVAGARRSRRRRAAARCSSSLDTG